MNQLKIPCPLLGFDDIDHRQRAGKDDHGQNRSDHRDFVADNLRGRTNAAEQGVLVVGAPAGHQQRDDGESRDGEDVKDADVEIGDDYALAERNDDVGEKGGDKADDRRPEEDYLVARGDANIFLLQQFHGIHDGLIPAVPAGAHRAEALLNVRGDFALPPDQEQRHQSKEAEDNNREQNVFDNGEPGIAEPGGGKQFMEPGEKRPSSSASITGSIIDRPPA